MCTTNRKQQNVMSLLEEYKTSDVVGFSFSPKDYIEEKIMLDEHLNPIDEPSLQSMDCLPDYITDIKENGVFEFGSRTVILRGDQVYDWIIGENLSIHNTKHITDMFFTLEIHDHSDVWTASFFVNDEPVELSL